MSYPRPPRRRNRPVTQADLIATALQVEEENIESLRIWLEEEEERKRVNKIARKVVAGPRISWISRRVDSEKEKKGGEKKEEKGRGKKGKDKGDVAEQNQEVVIAIGEGTTHTDILQVQQPTDGAAEVPPVSLPPPPVLQPPSTTQSTTEAPEPPTTPVPLPQPPISTPSVQPIETQPTEPQKDQPYERNYLILSSIQGQANELKVLFGDHADWTALERIPIKHRSIRACRGISRSQGFHANILPFSRAQTTYLSVYRPSRSISPSRHARSLRERRGVQTHRTYAPP